MYNCTDDKPEVGTLYYRLKTVESSGTVKYSKVISVQFATTNTISVYPGIWKQGESLYINNPGNEKITILFYNLSGWQYGTAYVNNNLIPTGPIEKAKGLVLYKLINASGKMIAGGKFIIAQ
jgi:hypothetical protein